MKMFKNGFAWQCFIFFLKLSSYITPFLFPTSWMESDVLCELSMLGSKAVLAQQHSKLFPKNQSKESLKLNRAPETNFNFGRAAWEMLPPTAEIYQTRAW